MNYIRVKSNKIIDSVEELKEHASGFHFLVFPVYEDNRIHPCKQKVSAIYLCDNVGWDRFIIPINHSEKVNDISLQSLMDSLSQCSLYVWDKKSFLNHVNDSDNLFDIQLTFYLSGKEVSEPHLFQSYYNKWREFSNINTMIPISVLFKEITAWMDTNELPQSLVEIWSLCYKDDFKTYQYVLNTFQKVERNGIYHIDNGLEYTQYNLYTTTGRPSNRFGGINYAAMKKSDDTREKYVSRYEGGKFYLYDYAAFHPTIISNYLKIERPTDKSLHQWLGEQYFNKQELTPEEYEESKKLTFYYLYGDVSEVIEIPFYQKVNELIESFDGKTVLETPMFKRKIKVDGLNKQKIFNYFLQALESEINFVKIKQLNRLLADKESKLVLYTYDSFLIDYSPKDDINILKEIRKVLEWGNFTVTISQGKNYKNMEYISYL